MCEKTAGEPTGGWGWWVHAAPAGTVLFSAEAGRVAQLHFCFC